MDKHSSIFVAGHNGMVGSAIVRALRKYGYNNLLLRSHSELDLTKQLEVEKFFKVCRPQFVINAAAKVGGILANKTYCADFIYNNIMMQTNIINAAYQNNVQKLILLASHCVYPCESKEIIGEERLLQGVLDENVEMYAIAKIAGIKMCQAYNKQFGTNYIVAVPSNVYGINDNFHIQNSHVLAGLLRRFSEAVDNNQKQVVIWGSGKPSREFMFADDLADAVVFLMNNYDGSEIINVGTGEDIEIRKLAGIIAEIVGYQGNITYDRTKPDGLMKRCLDVSKLKELGWSAKTKLWEGLNITYQWYLENKINLRI